MAERNYTDEHQDNGHRKYRYDTDVLMRPYMLTSFQPWLREGSALEMGCYVGDFTEIFLQQFRDLTVVEAAPELVEATRKRVGDGVEFFVDTFEAVALPRKYDNIFLVHTLEHLDDRQLVLRRIRSWLSGGGRFFVAVPNANAPSRQIAVKMGLIEHNAAVTEGERLHGHRITYSLDTLESEVRQAGFKVVHRGGVLFKPLANFQLDKALELGVISKEFMDGCYALGMQYPDLCSSIYLVCEA